MLPNALQPSATDHVPVLADEVRRLLDVQPGDTVVDATFGAGGHAALLAADLAHAGRLIAIDRDPSARAYFERFRRRGGIQARFLRGEFATVLDQLAANGVEADAILLDLGVSSMQLDRPERGFSYAVDAPLDMRMDPSAELTAADIVNESSERELADDLPPVRRGALRTADRARDRAPAAPRAVRAHGRARRHDQGRDPDAGALRRRPSGAARLPGAPHRGERRARPARGRAARRRVEMLRPRGRLAVISFHSLEDRDRQALLPPSRRTVASVRRTSPICACGRDPVVRVADAAGRPAEPRARSRTTRAPRRRGCASPRRSRHGRRRRSAARAAAPGGDAASAAGAGRRQRRVASGVVVDRRSSPALLAGVVALNVAVLRLNLRLDDLGQRAGEAHGGKRRARVEARELGSGGADPAARGASARRRAGDPGTDARSSTSRP